MVFCTYICIMEKDSDMEYIRVYCFSFKDLEVMRCAIESGMVIVERSFLGCRGLMVMIDIRCSVDAVRALMGLGIVILPLSNYGNYEITCPVCGKVIDDDMILRIYDDNVLSGRNILCGRHACGYQLANVRLLL